MLVCLLYNLHVFVVYSGECRATLSKVSELCGMCVSVLVSQMCVTIVTTLISESICECYKVSVCQRFNLIVCL